MTTESAHTPTERKILALLADGRPHSRKEIHALLPDDLGALANIKPHLTAIRKTLRRRGEDIVCELAHGRLCYRHVRLISGT